jgi:hypothetical protein
LVSQYNVPTAGARYGEGKDCLLCSNSNLLGVLLVSIVFGVSPVYGSRRSTPFKLLKNPFSKNILLKSLTYPLLDGVPLKDSSGVVGMVLLFHNLMHFIS